MPLWSVANKKEPNYVNTENVIATDRGWELKRPDGTNEILVAIRGLKNKLGSTVSISSIKLLKIAATGVNKTLRVALEFSEAISYTLDDEVPSLTIYNENQSGENYGNYTLVLNASESKPELGLLIFRSSSPVPVAVGEDGLYVDNTSLDLDGLNITVPSGNDSVNVTVPYTRLNDVPILYNFLFDTESLEGDLGNLLVSSTAGTIVVTEYSGTHTLPDIVWTPFAPPTLDPINDITWSASGLSDIDTENNQFTFDSGATSPVTLSASYENISVTVTFELD